MVVIEEFENIIRKHEQQYGKDNYNLFHSYYIDKNEANCDTFHAYLLLKRTNNKLLDFNSEIQEKNVKDVIDTLRKLDITEFTVSYKSCDILEMLQIFEENGFKVAGLTKVKSVSLKEIPAILIKKV